MKKNLLVVAIIGILFGCKENQQNISPQKPEQTANLNRNAKSSNFYSLFKITNNGVVINANPPKEVYSFENGGGSIGVGTGGGAQSNPFYKFTRTVNGRAVEKGNAIFVTTADGNSYFKFYSSDPTFPNGSYAQWFVENYPTETFVLLTKRIGFSIPIPITNRLGGLVPVTDLTRYYYLATGTF